MIIDRGIGVIEEGNRCRICGRWIKAEYVYCIPCVRKMKKVFDDCIGSGMKQADAQRVVDRSYPVKFFQ